MSEDSSKHDVQKETNDVSEKSKTQLNNDEEIRDPKAVLAKNRELLGKLKELNVGKQELEDRLKEIEQDRLAKEGKKDELIAALKEQLKDRDTKLKDTTKTFGQKLVREQAYKKAMSLGAENPEIVLKLADINSLSLSDDFSIDDDELTLALEKVKKDVPALFKKQAAAPKDGIPGYGIEPSKKLSEMKKDDLAKAYMEIRLKSKK